MTYLLAKYTLLFLLTALLGIILGYWWSRRSFVDVSDSFEALTRANRPDTSLWDRLWQKLDVLAKPDLSGLYQRLEGVTGAISELPRPQPVSFASVDTRLDSLAETVSNIPARVKSEVPDLRPVNDRLAEIESAIKAMPAPEKPKAVDLVPVISRLSKLEEAIARMPQPKPVQPISFDPLTSRIEKLETAIRNLPRPQPAEPVRLEPLTARIDKLDTIVRAIPAPVAPQRVDLAPVTSRINKLEEAIARIPEHKPTEPVRLEPLIDRIEKLESAVRDIPRPKPVSLQPFDRRLDTISTEIRNLNRRLVQPAQTPAPSAPRTSEPRLLEGASYGKKDDLKRISGVGPNLESLLNENGVYYFWQVASWTRSDIALVDARLAVFKGRIERDDWVSQAKKLKLEPGAAKEPAA